MAEIHEDDLRRLYAKQNAQDILISVCLGAILQREDSPAAMLERLRVGALEMAERQRIAANDPNPEFAARGRVETLAMVAAVFASLKGAV